MDSRDFEGRQVEMSEAGILEVMEVPFCQGVPRAGTPAVSPWQAPLDRETDRSPPILLPPPVKCWSDRLLFTF